MVTRGPKRKFNEQEALDRLVFVFWSKGYDRVSYDDLVQTTQVNRHSLYAVFGDKTHLLCQALERYVDHTLNRVLDPLMAEDARLNSVIAYLDQLKLGVRDESIPRGCLVCQTMNSGTYALPGVRERTDRMFARLQSLLLRALENAKAKGELAADLKVETLALEVVGWMLAAATMAKSPTLCQKAEDFLSHCQKRLLSQKL